MSQVQEDKKKSRPNFGKNTPPSGFPDLISYDENAYTLGGSEGSWDVLTRALGTSTTNSSTFTKRAYAVRNLGLWDLDAKTKSYKITHLGEEIASPESNEAKIHAIQKAFRTNETLAAIWDFFKGKTLPTDEFLPNAIARNCGVPNDLKDAWKDYFLEAGYFAQIIQDRGSARYVTVGYIPTSISKTEGPPKDDPLDALPSTATSIENQPVSTTARVSLVAVDNSAAINDLAVLLKGGTRFQKKAGESYALIYIPDGMTKEEVERVRPLLKAAEVLLEAMSE